MRTHPAVSAAVDALADAIATTERARLEDEYSRLTDAEAAGRKGDTIRRQLALIRRPAPTAAQRAEDAAIAAAEAYDPAATIGSFAFAVEVAGAATFGRLF